MRPEWKLLSPENKCTPEETALKIRQLKEQLAACARQTGASESFTERGGRQGSVRKRDVTKFGQKQRSLSADRGYLSKLSDLEHSSNYSNITSRNTLENMKASRACSANGVTDSSMKSNHAYSFENRFVSTVGHANQCDNSHHAGGDSTPLTPSSFVQQRIERLYGPGALAMGFASRRSRMEMEKSNNIRNIPITIVKKNSCNNHEEVEENPEEVVKAAGLPMVFRHLRPEFRTQLTVKRNNNNNVLLRKLSQEEGDFASNGTTHEVASVSRVERVIPITIEGGVIPSSSLISGEINGCLSNGSHIQNEPLQDQSPLRISEVPIPILQPATITDSTELTKDGHFYIKQLEEVVRRIEVKVVVVEEDFQREQEDLSEEIRGLILATVGKARLLISQKLQQFHGLCLKNLNGSIGEEFPTTSADLAGFWDMVSIQVEDVHNSLNHVKELKKNDWKEVSCVKETGAKKKTASGGKTVGGIRKVVPGGPKSEAARAREEARKKAAEDRRKMLEERRRAIKVQKEQQKLSDAVEIFVPE